LQTSLSGYQSGFTLLDDNGAINASQKITLEANAPKTLNIQFNGSVLGNARGSLVITANGSEGHILVPLGALVQTTTQIKIIASSFLCSNKNAPTLDTLDFMRVASGRSQLKSFKICNTSPNTTKVNKITFLPNLTTKESKALEPAKVPEFFWDIEGALEKTFFDYYNPGEAESFEETQTIPYTQSLPATHTAFTATVHNPVDSNNTSTNNQVIPAASYVLVDVRFSPALNAEAPENQAFEPIAYGSQMQINTSLGNMNLTALGATGGYEPLLKVLASAPDNMPAGCASTHDVDLSSETSTINFGIASIYEDWVPEDAQTVRLRLCNMGSGTKTLKVWGEPITKGYFTYVETNDLVEWPLEIAPGKSRLLTLAYTPTPSNNVTSSSWDLGQLYLSHNASNGPYTGLTLFGTQEKSAIINVSLADSKLKTTYPANKPKKLQCLKIGGESSKILTITNNSPKNILSSQISLTNLSIADSALKPTYKILHGTNIESPNVDTNPNATNKINIKVKLPGGVSENTLVTGLLKIKNKYANATAAENLDYNVNFEATASKTGECSSGGSGIPVDDAGVMIIDRITMNLLGLSEPARNPPSFKFHLPIDIDKANKRAKVTGLKYDPTDQETNDNPVKQIRSYAHQITDVTFGCPALPSNPYKLEFEEGSWDSPNYRCSWKSADDPNLNDTSIDITAGTACIKNNGATEETITDPVVASDLGITPGDKVKVFYHEFAKFGSDCSTPDIVGKIATFVLKEKPKVKPDDPITFESIPSVFDKMIKDYGTNGTEADYATITRTYQFNSYIQFNTDFHASGDTAGICDRKKGELIRDPDQIKACWNVFRAPTDPTKDTVFFTRANGFVEECSYFQFEIEEGCGPEDAKSADPTTKARCKDVDFKNPDTWKGYGEYEPVQDANIENAYNLTLRNVRIDAFTLVHSLNTLFEHPGKLLYSPLYVTLTTKAVGRTNGEDYKGYAWNTLIATNARSDFNKSNVLMSASNTGNSATYWIGSGVNGKFTVGKENDAIIENGKRVVKDGEFDAHDCVGMNAEHCRGNYEFNNGKLLHAGEPINFDQEGRSLLVGLASFHGKGNLAPIFAKEEGGVGAPLYFTFHACLKQAERDENGKIIDKEPTAGCYEKDGKSYLDPGINSEGGSVLDDYLSHGILTNQDLDPDNLNSKALINFKIFDEDRERLTNYYEAPENEYNFDPDHPFYSSPCGKGN